MESIKTNFQNVGKSTLRDKKIAKKATGWAWSIFRFLLLAGLAFSLLYPIMYMFSMAFKAQIDVSDITVKWIPKHFTIENVTRVIEGINYVPALIFSFVVSFICALLSAISGSLTGYGLARFKFKGQGNSLCKIQTQIGVAANPTEETFDCGIDQYNDTEQF